MSIDDLLPVDSGTLFFFDCEEYLNPIEKNETNYFKDSLRGIVTCIVLPYFSLIGAFYNFFAGLIKIPFYLYYRKYQTKYFQQQLRGHFYYAFLDAISWFSSFRYFHCVWAILNFIDPSKTLEIVNAIREDIFPKIERYFIDPNLSIDYKNSIKVTY